ncbi:3-isopropylmalate dehydrogenase, partial [Vibrio vulnificus]
LEFPELSAKIYAAVEADVATRAELGSRTTAAISDAIVARLG